MKRELYGLALAAVCLTASSGAQAQSGQGALRRFTELPTDTNRSNRINYVPIGWSFSEARPGKQPYDVSVASWYRVPISSTNAKPDKVLDSGKYQLERFDRQESRPGGPMLFRVVITRRPAPVADGTPPRLQLINGRTGISSLAFATQEVLSDGIRYTFMAEPPLLGLATSRTITDTEPYEIRLMPARDITLPSNIARAPTFGGEDIETRQAMAPPRLTRDERVAGKRIEYRDGRVIDRQKR